MNLNVCYLVSAFVALFGGTTIITTWVILKNSCTEFENALDPDYESEVFTQLIFKLVFGLILIIEGLVGLVNGINGGQQLKM